jgi:hypothetical protein
MEYATPALQSRENAANPVVKVGLVAPKFAVMSGDLRVFLDFAVDFLKLPNVAGLTAHDP